MNVWRLDLELLGSNGFDRFPSRSMQTLGHGQKHLLKKFVTKLLNE